MADRSLRQHLIDLRPGDKLPPAALVEKGRRYLDRMAANGTPVQPKAR